MNVVKSLGIRALLASCLLASGLLVQPGMVMASDKTETIKASATGEVRRVDAKAGKVTIKHGPISALELPAITLVYQAAPVLLINIEPGDRVRFTATRQNDAYVVTELSK